MDPPGWDDGKPSSQDTSGRLHIHWDSDAALPGVRDRERGGSLVFVTSGLSGCDVEETA